MSKLSPLLFENFQPAPHNVGASAIALAPAAPQCIYGPQASPEEVPDADSAMDCRGTAFPDQGT
eukprot:1161620-Rhodomonas_salina.1